MANQVASLLATQDEVPILERTSLKEQIADLLRERIVSGHFAPGAALVERELAEQLRVSRIPVRDALMQLETEGLVVSTTNTRCVIALTERDIQELYQVRLVLEKLAVRLAAENASEADRNALVAQAREMKEAVDSRNRAAYRRSDVATHRLIWQMSGNAQLVRTLQSMVGPIFMLVARHAEHFDWSETRALHDDLVDCIVRGDAAGAEASIERHLENATQRSLRLFSMGLL